jgi:hypothetical protein
VPPDDDSDIVMNPFFKELLVDKDIPVVVPKLYSETVEDSPPDDDVFDSDDGLIVQPPIVPTVADSVPLNMPFDPVMSPFTYRVDPSQFIPAPLLKLPTVSVPAIVVLPEVSTLNLVTPPLVMLMLPSLIVAPRIVTLLLNSAVPSYRIRHPVTPEVNELLLIVLLTRAKSVSISSAEIVLAKISPATMVPAAISEAPPDPPIIDDGEKDTAEDLDDDPALPTDTQ